MRAVWLAPIFVLSTALLPGLASHATALPAGCEHSEVDDAIRYDSPHFREEWVANIWRLTYPPRERGTTAQLPDLFPTENLDQLAADPDAAGARLMERVDDQLCRSRPRGYTLEWSTYLQAEYGGTGPAWLTLVSRQLVDGIPVQGRGCHVHYDRWGALLNLSCHVLAQRDVALPAEDWPDDADVAAIAEAAYLDDLRNLPGPGQNVQSIERLYRDSSPTLIASHVGCGTTAIDARTLEANYNCDYGWPERPVYGVAGDESVVLLDNLPPDFEKGTFAVDGRDGYLLVGYNSHPWTDATGLSYEEARYLLAFDATGQLRWRHRVAYPHELLWFFPVDDGLMLWQQIWGENGTSSVMRAQMLSLADGQPLELERLFDIPPYRRILPDAIGSRIYTLRDIEQQWQVWAQDRNGAVLWRADVPEADTSSELALSSKGGLAVLSHTPGDDPLRYKLRDFARDGRLRRRVDLPVPKRHEATLLGVEGERAYLRLWSMGADSRGRSEVLIYSTTDNELLQRYFLPNVATLEWLPGGKALYIGGEGGWALVGAAGSDVPWRRYFGFGVRTQAFSHAVVDGKRKLALLTHLEYQRRSSLEAARRAILRLDLSTAGEHGRAADCPLVTDDTLRKLELALWRDFHVYPAPTLMDYLPNLACIDAHRAHYRDFMQALHDDLTRRAYRAPGFFVYLTVEPGQTGLRFRGGGAGLTPRWDQGGYHLRAQFDDAARLAAYLQNTLEPHARQTYRLRDDFLLHTGAELSLIYSREGGPERLEKMESDLVRLLEIARSTPSTAFPSFGRWAPPALKMDGSRLGPLNDREEFGGRPVPLAGLDAENLRSLFQAEKQAWSLQRKAGCKENLAQASDPDDRLMRALNCDDLEQLRRALSLGANPRRRTGGVGNSPLVHFAVLNSPRGLEALVEAGADPLARDNQGNTVLHYAAMAGARDVLARLSADEALVNAVAHDGATPLHRAVFAPRFPAPLLAPLVRGQRDIDARNSEGETALHLATHSPEVVELLLAAGADPNARDQRGTTPLHRAAAVWLGADSVVALLTAGADPGLRDETGKTPQMIAEQRRLPVNAAVLAGREPP